MCHFQGLSCVVSPHSTRNMLWTHTHTHTHAHRHFLLGSSEDLSIPLSHIHIYTYIYICISLSGGPILIGFAQGGDPVEMLSIVQRLSRLQPGWVNSGRLGLEAERMAEVHGLDDEMCCPYGRPGSSGRDPVWEKNIYIYMYMYTHNCYM